MAWYRALKIVSIKTNPDLYTGTFVNFNNEFKNIKALYVWDGEKYILADESILFTNEGLWYDIITKQQISVAAPLFIYDEVLEEEIYEKTLTQADYDKIL